MNWRQAARSMFGRRSDQEIARATGRSPSTIGRYRRSLGYSTLAQAWHAAAIEMLPHKSNIEISRHLGVKVDAVAKLRQRHDPDLRKLRSLAPHIDAMHRLGLTTADIMRATGLQRSAVMKLQLDASDGQPTRTDAVIVASLLLQASHPKVAELLIQD